MAWTKCLEPRWMMVMTMTKTFAWEKKCFKTYASPVAYTIPRGGATPHSPPRPREGARARTRPPRRPPTPIKVAQNQTLNHEATTREGTIKKQTKMNSASIHMRTLAIHQNVVLGCYSLLAAKLINDFSLKNIILLYSISLTLLFLKLAHCPKNVSESLDLLKASEAQLRPPSSRPIFYNAPLQARRHK